MSQWYLKGRNAFGTGDIDWINDPIIAVLIATSHYTPDFTNDTFLSDIPSSAIISKASLTGKTMIDCVARAVNTVFPKIDSELSATAVVLAKDTSVVESSSVFLFISSGTGFPYYAPGEDCILRWNDNGIFVL